MTRTVDAAGLGDAFRDLLSTLAAEGTPVLISDSGKPIALLEPVGSAPGPWNAWLDEARARFGGAGEPDTGAMTEIDKVELGFDPSSGSVGSEGGRDHLAGELRNQGVPVVDDALLTSVYAAVLELCEEKERIYRADLKAIAQELINEAPQRLRLLSLNVQTATGVPAMAEVTLSLDRGPAMRREHGDGPLHAAFNAIERLTGLRPEVRAFSVVSATPGQDAMAAARIELELEGSSVVGAGASTNAIEAGVNAYLNALNFLYEARRGPGSQEARADS